MDEIMQVLFNDVIDRLLQKYYDQTAYATRCKSRDEIEIGRASCRERVCQYV